jgi:hypothetical protein
VRFEKILKAIPEILHGLDRNDLLNRILIGFPWESFPTRDLRMILTVRISQQLHSKPGVSSLDFPGSTGGCGDDNVVDQILQLSGSENFLCGGWYLRFLSV